MLLGMSWGMMWGGQLFGSALISGWRVALGSNEEGKPRGAFQATTVVTGGWEGAVRG